MGIRIYCPWVSVGYLQNNYLYFEAVVGPLKQDEAPVLGEGGRDDDEDEDEADEADEAYKTREGEDHEG